MRSENRNDKWVCERNYMELISCFIFSNAHPGKVHGFKKDFAQLREWESAWRI